MPLNKETKPNQTQSDLTRSNFKVGGGGTQKSRLERDHLQNILGLLGIPRQRRLRHLAINLGLLLLNKRSSTKWGENSLAINFESPTPGELWNYGKVKIYYMTANFQHFKQKQYSYKF